MTAYSFDSNIIIDSLNGNEAARDEIKRAGPAWISRVTWIEVMSKGGPPQLRAFEAFLSIFQVDDVSDGVCRRASVLRRERPRLKLPDAVILASAQVHGRILVTRNTRDFPANMPGIRVPYTIEGR